MLTPSPLPLPLRDATDVADGVATFRDGTVRTWGGNSFGSLGTGGSVDATSARGVLVRSLSGIVRVWAGGGRDLALKSDGTLYLWGPSGTDKDFRVPTVMATFSDTASAVAGGRLQSLPPVQGGVAVVKKLALVAIGFVYLGGTAMAQDAKTAIANAQKALGDPKAVTYSGSAKDVAFQQCGTNAAAAICQGMHDPMRPIANYVRVIDLAAPASRHTGSTNNPTGGGATTPVAGTYFQQVTPEQANLSQALGRLGGALPHAVGFPERRGGEHRDREPAQSRREELRRPGLEPRGEGAVRQELRRQWLRG